GTSVQSLGLTASDFGGPSLEGCNDYLVISRPDVVESIHASFFAVGCDVVETDTFRSNRLTLKEYDLHDRVIEINRTAATIARRTADKFATADRPRFVAGSIGPTGFLPSTSDPTLGNITYDEIADVFEEQARGLLEGGVDVLLIETSQDILEVKAQITGVRRALRELNINVPIQAQVTLDTSERMLLGTDIAAAMTIIESLRADVIGLNCSTGPEHMRNPVRYLCENSRLPVSVIPNAGIPLNDNGRAIYPLSPEALADAHEEFVTKLGVNIVGGCCGTTPEHLRQVVERVWGKKPARRDVTYVPRVASAMTAYDMVQDPAPTLIGERVNSQGSRAVKRLLLADDYEGVVAVGRDQSESGAHLLDVCVALTERQDEVYQMKTLVKLLAQSVETPLVFDTTEADVVEAALKAYPGRATVNSIHLENGRTRIEAVVPHIVQHGAAVVALTIDEVGMAKTADRKLEVARRIHDICVDEYGLEPEALIFDDLTFTLATGDAEFNRSAIETVEGIKLIKRELPGVLTSLGVSNVSFGLSPHARAVLNSVFLHHCVEAGLDMAIVNPAHIKPYAEIDEEQRKLADDLIFYTREDALARFIQFYENTTVQAEEALDPTADMQPEQALHWKILHRKKDGIESLIDAAVQKNGGGNDGGIHVLNNVLLPAMKEVGDKFGAGELILPFVLQSAEVMKRAVARVETYLDKVEGQTKGKVVIATVFGDVHDIGKSLVNTIMSNNGYTVYDLGKQVPINTIIEKAVEVGADAIGLSALLVSTSKQMPLCVQELHKRGLSYPVLIGGAAINPSFGRMASFVDQEKQELYPNGVYYCKDAFEGLETVDALQNPDRRKVLIAERHKDVIEGTAKRAALVEKAKGMRPASAAASAPSRDIEIPTPPAFGVKKLDRLPLQDLFKFFDLNTLYRLHWGAKNAKGEEYDKLVKNEFEPRLKQFKQKALESDWFTPKALYGYFPVASDGNDLVVFDNAGNQEIGRFEMPRQHDRDHLCLADYFAPIDGGKRDVAAIQIVTVGDKLLEQSDSMMKGGDYSEGYYLHGFGVRLAEAAAEYVNREIRRELGIDKDRGLRYSWGYPAIPDHQQHHLVFKLLPAREQLGMDVTEAGALVPELSTAAIVVHHPEAKYFST
ncbi:MAG TPA: methionine synthase, partial [Longimicrobiales bacterium]|nr:methionine synthase [Longimicrobiales bacterium]